MSNPNALVKFRAEDAVLKGLVYCMDAVLPTNPYKLISRPTERDKTRIATRSSAVLDQTESECMEAGGL